jgi:hypothetical protein
MFLSAFELSYVNRPAVVLVAQRRDTSQNHARIFLVTAIVLLTCGVNGQDAQFDLATASNHEPARPNKQRWVRVWTVPLCLRPSGVTFLPLQLASLVRLLTSLVLSHAKLLVLQFPRSFAIAAVDRSLLQIPALLWKFALVWMSRFLASCLAARSIVLLKTGVSGPTVLMV